MPIKYLLNRKENHNLLLAIFTSFIIIEFIDDYLDYKLGVSFLHSVIQIFLYVILFIIIYSLFHKYYKKKIEVLLPIELMKILNIVKNAESKNTLLNQKKVMQELKITKPTMKKRIDTLLELDYIYFEQKGNHKYLRLSSKGKSLL